MRRAFFLLLAVVPMCAGCGRVAERAMMRAGGAAERRSAAIMARDLDRDLVSKVSRLRGSRRVFKYTTKAEAERMMKEGIPVGSHFTSNANPGRPLASSTAAERLGLGYNPQNRLSVTLPEGTPVR